MTPREALEAFWAGDQPDWIPYTIYEWEWRQVADDPRWQPMFRDGLRVTVHAANAAVDRPEHQWSTVQHTVDGRTWDRRVLRTPVGEISEDFEQGWRRTFPLKCAEDYRVMTWLVRHSTVRACYEQFASAEAACADWGVVHTSVGRTPMQSLLVDWIGLENFGCHLVDLAEPLLELYTAQLELYRRVVEVVAAGPGRYVQCLENFTAETMGPRRFAEYHLPVYRELWPRLQAAGKIVGTHYDGKLASVADLVAASPTDMIESFTPPPEGDLTLAEARARLGGKLLWSNLNIEIYQRAPREIERVLVDRVAEGAPDGRRLAFEVSEHLPRNWYDSMPVVLRVLRGMRA